MVGINKVVTSITLLLILQRQIRRKIYIATLINLELPLQTPYIRNSLTDKILPKFPPPAHILNYLKKKYSQHHEQL